MILFSCKGSNLSFIFNIVGYLISLIKYIIPVVLIVLISIDVFKLIVNPDDKNKASTMSKIATRLIYAIILFLVPTLVSLIFKFVAQNTPEGYGGNDNSVPSWLYCIFEKF